VTNDRILFIKILGIFRQWAAEGASCVLTHTAPSTKLI